MKTQKSIVVFSFIILVALLGNPYAFNPIASTPVIQEAYAESTKFLGSERGDTWNKNYFKDGDKILVEQTFGVPEYLNDGKKFVPYIYDYSNGVHTYSSGQISFTLNELVCEATIFEKGKVNVNSDIIIPSLSYKVFEALGNSNV